MIQILRSGLLPARLTCTQGLAEGMEEVVFGSVF